ncbi:LETM1-related biofilm-associated protein [Galbibacter sp. EGI 63066]|uniref:LETM1-related biofilm-associated protein n=1 Tax=Galbibacter sp. EGI 63066 TaxID=2993559 RepID=UPI002248C057|nr:LETM1-related biofilm-associated protein [Galbibacter sp. EGI 63066]MCX2680237.1 LETM1-related biofilm-associated protein [Galbibacter sp. EGI 63066]
MNPSAQGWIDKFASIVQENKRLYSGKAALYLDLRQHGFIYGANVSAPVIFLFENELSEDELAKINLLTALYSTYQLQYEKAVDFKDFLKNITQFYKELEAEKLSFIDHLFTGKKASYRLEKILHDRVHVLDNFLTKNFSKILTNSLLFTDVLMYYKFLNGVDNLKFHAKKIERILINLAYHTIASKGEKTENDDQLLKLFNASLLYNTLDDEDFDGSYRDELKGEFDYFEKKYFIDMVCLSAWEDHSMEYKESEFIFGTGKDLKLDENSIKESIDYVSEFFEQHKDEVSLFKSANPLKQFFDNSNTLVKRLINRNSKRLQKELSQSKELLFLLSKSATTELTDKERKKIKDQLLDIFKTIPSLAIFALPGGAILLPVFIKLIPTLLPSAFDDNRVEEE